MDKLREKGETGLFKLQEELISWRGSRKLIILIVAIALLLDNMLLTSVGMFRFGVFVSPVSLLTLLKFFRLKAV